MDKKWSKRNDVNLYGRWDKNLSIDKKKQQQMKPVKVDRDGTPLLMVGNYTQNTRRRRRRVQSARRSRPSSSKTSLTSLWKRPSSSNVISKKKRPSSAAYRNNNVHIQNALAIINQLHDKNSSKRRQRKVYNGVAKRNGKKSNISRTTKTTRRPQSAPYKRIQMNNINIKQLDKVIPETRDIFASVNIKEDIPILLQNQFAKIATRKRQYTIKSAPTLIERLAARNQQKLAGKGNGGENHIEKLKQGRRLIIKQTMMRQKICNQKWKIVQLLIVIVLHRKYIQVSLVID